jgi:DNA (cytosine-5)-methyltransferase 1
VPVCFSSKDHGADAEADLAPTLRAGAYDRSHANAGVPPAIAFALRGREEGAVPEVGGDQVGALRAANGGSSRDYVAFDTTQITSAANYSNPQPGDACHPLAAGAHPPAIAGSAVRRLTPRECERLQGFPDDFTLIPWRKGMAPDGPRYKALGNSMAVPVMAWIGRRIAAVDAIVRLERVA